MWNERLKLIRIGIVGPPRFFSSQDLTLRPSDLYRQVIGTLFARNVLGLIPSGLLQAGFRTQLDTAGSRSGGIGIATIVDALLSGLGSF